MAYKLFFIYLCFLFIIVLGISQKTSKTFVEKVRRKKQILKNTQNYIQFYLFIYFPLSLFAVATYLKKTAMLSKMTDYEFLAFV